MSEAVLVGGVSGGGEVRSPRRLTTVLSADICGYSRLAELDEGAAVKTVKLVYQIFENAVTRFNGRVFNRAGDAFCAEFQSVIDGFSAAMEFTATIRAHDTMAPNNPAAKVRAGIHVGDVVEQTDGDLLGHGVNIAARLQSEAEPNGVLASSQAVNLVRDKIDAHFQRRGQMTLKNIDEPVVGFDVYASRDGLPRLSARLRKLSKVRGISPFIFGALIFVIAVNFILVDQVRRHHSRTSTIIGMEQEILSLDDRIELLSDEIFHRTRKDIDPSYQAALRDTIGTLLRSEASLFATVVDFLNNGNIAAAIRELRLILEQPSDTSNGAGTPTMIALGDEDRIEALRATATLSYTSDTQLSLSSFEKLFDEHGQRDPQTLNLLGQLYLRVNRAEEARAMFLTLDTLHGHKPQPKIQSALGLGKSHWFIAYTKGFTASEKQNQFDKSEQFFKQALASARENELTIEEGKSLASLGALNVLTGNYALAESLRKSALVIEDASGDAYSAGKSLNLLGLAMTYLGRTEEAFDYYERSLRIRKELNDNKGISSVLTNMAELNFRLEDYESARSLYFDALAISLEQATPTLISEHYQGLAKIADVAGDGFCTCSYLHLADRAVQPSEFGLVDESKALFEKYTCGPPPTSLVTSRC